MRKKGRKAKPRFRVQRLERRVLMSATWIDSSGSTDELNSVALENLSESPFDSFANATNGTTLTDPSPEYSGSSFYRVAPLASEATEVASQPAAYAFEPLEEVQLKNPPFPAVDKQLALTEMVENGPSSTTKGLDLGLANDSAGQSLEIVSPTPNQPLEVLRRELVLIDTGIFNYQQLVDDLVGRVEPWREIQVHLIDHNANGWEQTHQWLSGYQTNSFDTLHIVSHASNHAIKMGSTWVDSQSLAERQDDFQLWGSVLRDDGDLLFYGCDLASGDVGRQMLEQIAVWTGADIAASDTLIGAETLGGNWQLNYQHGDIEANIAFSAELQESWQGLLSTFTVTTTNDSGAGSLRQAILDANALAGVDNISFNIATTAPGYNLAGLGIFTIQPTSALPTITEAVIIDATTQSQYVSSPVIEIDGSNAGVNSNGFSIGSTGGGSTIKGFAINGYASGSGIAVSTGGQNIIEGNLIGLRPNASDAVEGALGWWKGEGNTLSAIGSDTATWIGTAGYATGKVGTAFNLDGNTYLKIEDQASHKPSTITTEAWIYATQFDGWDSIIAKGSLTSSQNSYLLCIESGKATFYTKRTGSGFGFSKDANSLVLNQWYHLVGTDDGVTRSLFVNGTLVDSDAVSGSLVYENGVPLLIGEDWNWGVPAPIRFNGRIDEVAIYGRALSTTEITANYNNGLAGKSPAKIPLVSSWQGEGDATDSRGFNNGALTNGATIDSSGKIGSAFSFDGINDHVAIDHENNFDFVNSQATISGWFKTSATGVYQTILGKGATSEFQYKVQVTDSNQLWAGLTNSAGSTLFAKYSNATVTDGRWHHFAFAFDVNALSEDVKLYLDGIEQTTVSADQRATLNYAAGSAPVLLGTMAGTQYFNGQIDELSFHNGMLSSTAVANLFASQSRDTNSFVAAPVASFKAEGNAADFHGNNEGTMTNGATLSSGIAGQGFFLDGLNDYIQIPDAAALDFSSSLTVAAWINPTTVSDARIFDKITSGAADGYLLDVVGGKLRLQIGGTAVTGATTINAAQWTHIAGVYDGSTIKVYINGVLDATAAYSGHAPVNARDLRLGADSNGTSLFSGRIDEAVAYNVALSASEIAALVSQINQSTIGNNVGLSLNNTAGNVVGGINLPQRNVIAYNTGDGIWVDGPAANGNSILGNSIYSNGSTASHLGIDLGSDGVNANDLGDGDEGPNNGQNSPIITSAVIQGGNTIIAGTLNSHANSTYRIELFSNPTADISGYGGGLTYLGSVNLSTDGSGNASFSYMHIGELDGYISATVTEDLGSGHFGSTSEYALASSGFYTISGTVFEDVNFGGGSGRDYSTATTAASLFDIDAEGAIVELYDASGNFVISTTTDNNGQYSFDVAAGNYFVRVVNDSVISSRPGYTSSLRAVQTYQTEASNGVVVAVTDHVGGQRPDEVDANANSGTETLASLNALSNTEVQSLTSVLVTSSSLSNLDFGFNFNTIVNTKDAGQGSLRQFILNSNTLANTNLEIAGQTAGKDVSIFMISDGQSHAGLNTSYLNLLTGTVGIDARAAITLASALPTISGADTVISGETQTTLIGNTNSGSIGTGGTVGVGADGILGTGDESTLSLIARPEVEIIGGGGFSGITIAANDTTISGIAIRGFSSGHPVAAIVVDPSVTVTADQAILRSLIIGATATGTDPGSGAWNSVGILARGATYITNSFIAFNQSLGVDFCSPNGTSSPAQAMTVTNSEFVGNGAQMYGNSIQSDVNNVTIQGNLVRNSLVHSGWQAFDVGAIELWTKAGTSKSGIIVQGNSILNNDGSGISVWGRYSNVMLSENQITGTMAKGHANSGSGILLASSLGVPNGVSIRRNAIYNNDALAIDIEPGTAYSKIGDGVTINNGAISVSIPNSGIDHPVFSSVVQNGNTLTVSGYVGTAAGDPDFANATIELFKAAVDSSGYGEGVAYLGSITGSVTNGNFTGSISLPAGVSLSAGDTLTSTATIAHYGTSEFGLNTTIRSLSGVIFNDLNGNLLSGVETIGDINNPGLAGVSVVLYADGGDGLADGVDDILMTTTTTDAIGQYAFNTGGGTYWVVVDSRSIVSSTPLNTGFTTGDLWAEQTYAVANAVTSTGFKTVAGAIYGGRNVELSDNATLLSTSEHVTRAVVSSSNVANINSGFSFDVVTRTGDGDNDLSNSRSMQGSLRQFIQNSNALVGIQTSNFELQTVDSNYNGHVWNISPTSALPFLTDAVVLNGLTQSGSTLASLASGSPHDLKVVIDGNLVGTSNSAGLSVRANNTVVQGLVVGGWDGSTDTNGLEVINASGVSIIGNYIGTDATGLNANANRRFGIMVLDSADTFVQNNLISGNSGTGLYIAGAESSGTMVQGNVIGLNATGTNVLGNIGNGVSLTDSPTNITIGGYSINERNVISGNTDRGIQITGGSGNTIAGNYIGTDVTGTNSVGNGQYGIQITSAATGNTIGGATTASGNLFAGNVAGVTIQTSSNGNMVTRNNFFGHSGLRIDLGGDGTTSNDGSKTTGEANLLMDAPVIELANLVGNQLTLSGYIGSQPGQGTFANASIEFYKSTAAGLIYLGTETTGGNGNFDTSIDVTGLGIQATDSLVAIATDTNGNTSEFSFAFQTNVAPAASFDTALASEAGGVANAVPGINPSGNVLNNDSDPNSGDVLTVTGVAAGLQLSPTGNVGTAVSGTYGTIQIAGNGSYTYTLNNNHSTVQALRTSNQTLQDVFTYSVTDMGGLTNVAQVTVTIEGTNDAPHNMAGSLQIDENSPNGVSVGTVTAYDVDAADALTFSLTDSAGGRFTIDNAGLITVANSILVDREAAASHSVNVRVTDLAGATSDKIFIIAINDIDEFDVGSITDINSTSNSVDENTSIGTLVGITAHATDADASNNTITYSLHDSNGGRFAIDAVTGVVTVAGALDREAGAASRNITIRATSTDGSHTDQIFSIIINDIDEFDVDSIIDANSDSNLVDENASFGTLVGITAQAADIDSTNNIVTYSLFDDDGGRFAVDSLTGVLTVAGTIDREADGASRSVIVRATSTDGSHADQHFMIAINDIDEYDVGSITDNDATSNNVNENATIGTVVGISVHASEADATNNTITYLLLNDDDGRFAIDSVNGIITVAGVIDREANGSSRNVIVRATSIDSSHTDQVFTITINDVDEFDVGSITDSHAAINNVAENSSIGTLVGITAQAFDADASNNTVTYSLSNSDNGRFAIDCTTGVITVAGAIDREVDGALRNLTVRATSSDGSHSDLTIGITINDVDEFDVSAVSDSNNAPNIAQEHSVAGTAVGLTIVAVDQDATLNSITYQLLDSAQGRFTIDAITGIITVADSSLLRYELGESFTLVVRSDSSDGSFTIGQFEVAIDNVNDAPVAITDNLDVVENGAQVLNVLDNDFDLDPGDFFHIVSVSIMNGLGNVGLAGNLLIYDPGKYYDYLSVGESANVVLSYTISDIDGLQSTAFATVTVHGERDALALDALSITSAEDNTVAWSISILPLDLNGEVLNSVLVSGLPQGTFLADNKGQQTRVVGGISTELIAFDLDAITISLPQHISGSFVITITTQSDLGPSSLQSITRQFNVAAVADSPTLSAQPTRGQIGAIVPLRINSSLIDGDGSEQLRVEVRGLPQGMCLADGKETRIIADANQWIDITNWNLSKIVLHTLGGLSGSYNVELRASATEAAKHGVATASTSFDLTLDQVMPVNEVKSDDKSATLENAEADDPTQMGNGIAIDSAHPPSPMHFHGMKINPPVLPADPAVRSATEFENETLYRSESHSSAAIPIPNFIKPHFEMVDAHIFDGPVTARSTSEAHVTNELPHRSERVDENHENTYASTQEFTILGSLNNTLLLAWTMIRSSVASIIGQNESSNIDDRRNTTNSIQKDERSFDKNANND
jgi:VCBS repeat-containing protein